MPGKVNPTQCEAMTMVCVQVHGNNAAVGFAGSQGNFRAERLQAGDDLQLPAFGDAAHRRLPRLRRITWSSGIELNRARIDNFVNNSLMLVTALSPKIGYDKAAKIAHDGARDHSSLREACFKLGYLSGEEFDALVRPADMTHP